MRDNTTFKTVSGGEDGKLVFINPAGSQLVRKLNAVMAWPTHLVVLGFLPWFNANYCGGSGWIFFAIALLWIATFGLAMLTFFSATKDHRMSPTEVRAYLDLHHPTAI
ncbi:MAG TPA: hypothetical protein VF655_10030 [Allosphingosinicella sp.]